jgi:methionyl-tRNA synthetase
VQSRKRKQEALSKEPVSAEQAKRKKANHYQPLEQFSKNLNSLFKELNSLEPNERQIAFEMVQTGLRNLNS